VYEVTAQIPGQRNLDGSEQKPAAKLRMLSSEPNAA
jgi:hypothetical protein